MVICGGKIKTKDKGNNMAPNDETCVLGNINRTEITQNRQMIATMAADIKEIKDKLLTRPTWFVAMLFTGLISLVVGLVITMMKTQ